MPLYEYRCHGCGKAFEVIQKFSDTPLTVHDECGGELEKLLSASALQFKGTGWYITDYGRNHTPPANNGKTESKKDAKSETKTESKPVATSSDK